MAEPITLDKPAKKLVIKREENNFTLSIDDHRFDPPILKFADIPANQTTTTIVEAFRAELLKHVNPAWLYENWNRLSKEIAAQIEALQ